MNRFTLLALLALAGGLQGSELRMALHAEPKTLDPLVVADEPAEAIRYLTEGVLVRINRLTQLPEAELAVSWKVSNAGKRVTFALRKGVKYPDGAAFTSKDVVETFRQLFDPALHSPIADTFQTEKGAVAMTAPDDYTVVADFPAPPPAFERLFDQVAIVSHMAKQRPSPGLGAFLIGERVPGSHLMLKRNPAYWKRQANGQALPRVDSMRVEFQQNRDLEMLRFQRGELDWIDSLTPDLFDRLTKEAPGSAVDAGPTTDTEFLWFNLAPQSPMPAYKKAWFQSQAFRQAISEAIQRADLGRLVYRGHASPSVSLVSPANRQWFNAKLGSAAFRPGEAAKRLLAAGFKLQANVLRDAAGHEVEFSVITNAGSKTRERMAAMIQQDLAKVGIQLNIVTLEFPSLIERITRTLDYETCLLGLVNIDIDPRGLMNVLLSSAANHAWNPSQKAPGTAWEAEIDKLTLAQAASADAGVRKKSFDRVQEILLQQAPMIFLLHPNSLSAVSKRVSGVRASSFFPHTFWDAEHVTVSGK
jgi:peptide/nickel transport system substrate-binding protein